MIVDDDRRFLEELGEALSSHGYDVVPSSDPAAVTEIAGTVKRQ